MIGRFQEVSAEVDVDFCQRNNIQIGRRFTGGGAVFHDQGNLNITIVTQRQRGMSLSQFHETNCTVITNVLDMLDAGCRYVPPNSIEIAGKKVSGAAAALGRDFAFWHASILVSTNEQMLNEVLQPSRTYRRSDFVRSRWQPVTALNSVLRTQVSVEEVKQLLVGSCESCFKMELEAGDLTHEERQLMESLHDRKYSSGEWNIHGHCWNSGIERKDGGTHTTIAV